jgi:hypothetical protein
MNIQQALNQGLAAVGAAAYFTGETLEKYDEAGSREMKESYNTMNKATDEFIDKQFIPKMDKGSKAGINDDKIVETA